MKPSLFTSIFVVLVIAQSPGAATELELAASKKVYLLGEPVVADIHLFNDSATTLSADLGTLGDPSLTKAWVLDEDSNTSYMVYPTLEPAARGLRTIEVAPGERCTVQRLLQLGERRKEGPLLSYEYVFLFGHAGQYRIWCTAPQYLNHPHRRSALRTSDVLVTVGPVPPEEQQAFALFISDLEELRSRMDIDEDLPKRLALTTCTKLKIEALVSARLPWSPVSSEAHQEAIRDYEALIRQFPHSVYTPWARFFIASHYATYHEQKRDDESQRIAANHFEALAKQSPNFPLKEDLYSRWTEVLSYPYEQPPLADVMRRYLRETEGHHTRLSVSFKPRIRATVGR